METIKSYTDLEQSKKLAEILPIESADMYYGYRKDKPEFLPYSDVEIKKLCLPCWSHAALLDVLPSATLDSSNNHHYRVYCNERFTDWYDNPVDACVAIVERLYELNLL